jgi:5-formyltetrahydrofolate cyclo-ligase
MTDSIENKANPLRAQLKQRRDNQDPVGRNRGALLIRGRLFTWLATQRTRLKEEGKPVPRHIAAFWSTADEPGLQPLLRQWAEEEGYSVSLPVITAPDTPLQFRLWTPDTELIAGPFGIEQPGDDARLAPSPDIVLVPTLGYTRQGDRIGYGKGYYDRTLAALKASGHPFTSIGIAWASGDLSGDNHTPAAHDVRLDSVLTDKGWAVPAPTL